MRRLILALLLLAYVAVFVHLPTSGSAARFDPLDPRGRQVERAIEDGRFADALPIVLDLQSSQPQTPVIAYWLAEVHRGLGHPSDEAQALEVVLALSSDADAACPALPEAYRRAGQAPRALDAMRRCAAAAPDDPERWLDLSAAEAAAGHADDAAAAYERSRSLDPSNPRLPAATAPSAASGEGRP